MNPIPKLIVDDPWLEPFKDAISYRIDYLNSKEKNLTGSTSLQDFASGYMYFGLHKTPDGWSFREWAPNATCIYLVGEFSNWQEQDAYKLKRISNGNWEIHLPADALKVEQRYKLSVHWDGGHGLRIPSYANRCIQNDDSKLFDAQVWHDEYQWKNSKGPEIKTPLIYEAHVGMATEEDKVGSFTEFRINVLPQIKAAGYNTVQLMAIQEHPYYGSFGYHVSNFFAVSSRFGTPQELKELIDSAHEMGLAVIMDIVHSHSVKNEIEGLNKLAGDPGQYFHNDNRREHIAWDSLCFDYGKNEVLHFLLSNCKYWLEEYKFDGFRFDGITSMLYYDHGLSKDFTEYSFYYDGNQDIDAIAYLCMANKLIHEINPAAITVAEEMSGMPGLAEPIYDGGLGFDYRMAMGTPDYWIKIIKEKKDDEWDMPQMYHELTSKRANEKTISYAESHDQALVGDKTIIFRLLDKEMYFHMNKTSQNLVIERGLALHKMIRAITYATSGGGYLNFMGNEFGHPEWIDFPREGNNWSYHYARRQWSLVENKELRYHFLSDFDHDMLLLQNNHQFLKDPYCYKICDNQSDKVIAFERGGLLFIFNFNPLQSYTDYGIQVSGNKYDIVLNSDDPKYGGFGNVDTSIMYYGDRQGGVSGTNWLKVYIPSRVALVLRKIETKSVYDL